VRELAQQRPVPGYRLALGQLLAQGLQRCPIRQLAARLGLCR